VAEVPSPSPPIATSPDPGPTSPRRSLPAAFFDDPIEEPIVTAPTFDPAHPPKVVYGPLEVIHESIFGPASKEDWKPLSLMTFFSEGWDEPFHNAPEGTNGAPKQNWIGAPNGVFGRFATLDFFYTNHLNDVPGVFLTPNAPFMPVHTYTTGNQYAVYGTFLLPLNSRVELLVGTVFIDSRKSSPAGHYVGNWGDTGVQARFHLIEQRAFSMVAYIGERAPTGKSVNGSDINYIQRSAKELEHRRFPIAPLQVGQEYRPFLL
jgi:hypothetical protein